MKSKLQNVGAAFVVAHIGCLTVRRMCLTVGRMSRKVVGGHKGCPYNILLRAVRAITKHLIWATTRVAPAVLFLYFASYAHAATLYWVGGNGDDPTANANDWSTVNPVICTDGLGNAGAVPGPGDTAVFDADCDNGATMTGAWTVGSLQMDSGYSGTIDAAGATLTVSGPAALNGGTLNNGTLDINAGTSDTVTFGGTVFGVNVESTSGALFLSGSTFNGTAVLEKTGTSADVGLGGNAFNAATTITVSGTGDLYTGQNASDTFNGVTTFTITNSGDIYPARTAAGTQFNENILFNSTGSGIIRLGASGGTSTLADTKTLGIGGDGFSGGTLQLYYLTQTGATAQSLTLTGSGVLLLGTGSTFNGNVSLTAPSLFFHGATFNGTVTAEKNGTAADVSNGGNTFNDTFSVTVSGTGDFYMGQSTADIFNGVTTFTITSSGDIYPSRTAAGTQFNENIVVNSTGTGVIRFGVSGGTATLADTKTITVGGTGFSSGSLQLYYLTQTGTAAQSLTLTGSATMYLGTGSVFNGAATFTAPQVFLSGSTFNGTATLETNGTSQTSSTGGCTFNAAVTLINSGTSTWYLGNGAADIFNGPVTFNNTSTGNIYPAYATGATEFNDDVLVNNASSGAIYFGGSTGTSTLADTKTITVGSDGFASGTLTLRGFTQVGTTAQNMTLTGTALLTLSTGTTFNGDVTFTVPQLFLNGSTFNGAATLEKNGAGNNLGSGGNTFNDTTTITNSSGAILYLGNTTADIFNGPVTFTNTSTGHIWPAYAAAGTEFNDDVLVNNGSTGTIYFGASTGTSSLADTKTITVGGDGFATGTLNLRGFTQTGATAQTLTLTGTAVLTLSSGTTFNGNVTFSSPQLLIQGGTFNGTATLEKSGAGNNAGAGGATFNGTTTIINSSSAILYLGNGAADIFNGQVTFTNTSNGYIWPAYATGATEFNDDIIINNPGGGNFSFGVSSGTSTLADTKTITVGGGGFASGTLAFRGFTQTGTTAQTLTLTGTAALTLSTGTTFNGNVNFTAPWVILNGSTFNGTAALEQTTASNNASSVGGNTYNSTVTLTNSGTGYWRLPASGSADTYNGNLTLVNSSTGDTHLAYGADVNLDENLSGANSEVTFGGNGGTLVFTKAAGTQTFDSGDRTVPRLTHSGAGTLQLTGNALTVSTALTNSAGTMDLNGQNLTATGATFSNAGVMQFRGTETITGLAQDTDSGTWTYVGDGDAGADSITIQDFGATDYFNLTINSTDGATDSYVLTSDKVIAGTLTVTSGDMETDGYDLDINGGVSIAGTLDTTDDVEGDATTIQVGTNWTNTGTFTYADSSVDFDDDTQNNTFTGDTTFNNLTISTAAAKTATFTAGSTQTVAGTMTFTGAASNLLTLQSSSGGTVWNLDPTGTRSVNYLNVSDSYNPGATINAVGANSTNGGNNTGWYFTAAAGSNVIWIGAGGDNNWSTGANWSSGSAPNSSQIAVFNATSVKNCTIDTNASVLGVSIASGYDGTITQSGANTITVGASDWIQADGTFTGGSGGFSTSGDLLINGGTFTPGTQTFTFTGATSTWTPGAGTYGDIVINKTAGHSFLLTAGTTADVDGSLTLTDGYLRGTTATVTLAGDLTIAAGFDGGYTDSVTIRLDGNGAQAINGSAGITPFIDINKSGGTASLTAATTLQGLTVTAGTFDPVGYKITFGNIGGYNWTPGPETYTDVEVSKSTGNTLTLTAGATADVDGTLTLTDGYLRGTTGTVTLAGDLTIGAGFDGGYVDSVTIRLDGNGAQAINGSAGITPFIDINKGGGTASLTAATTLQGLTVTAGTFDPAGYKITFGSVGGYNWTPGPETYGDVEVSKSTGTTLTLTAGTTADVDGTLTLTDGYLRGSTGTVTLAGDLTVGTGFDGGYIDSVTISLDGTGAQSINGSTGIPPKIDINKGGGTASLTADTLVQGLTVTSGTFDPAGYTLTFGSVGSYSWTPGAETYGNVIFNKTAGYTTTVTSNADINGNLTLTEAVVNGPGILNVAGNVASSATFDGGTMPLTFSGGAVQTFDLTGITGVINGDITIDKSGGQVNLLSALVMDAASQDLVIVEGALDLNGQNLTVSGAGGTFVVQDGGNLQLQGGETITGTPTLSSGSTVSYDGTSTYTIKNWTYHHLTLNGSGGTFAMGAGETLGGNLVVTAGRFDAADQTLTINGNTTVDGGIFHTGTGAVTFGDAGGDSVTISSGALIVESDNDADITLNAGTWTNSGGTMMYATDAAATLFNSATVQPYYDLNLNDGLLGYWKMDETAADSCADGVADACDSSGYGHDARWVGHATASATVPTLNFSNPRSVTLDGTGDYVNAGNMDAVNGASALSVALWVKLGDLTTDGDLLVKGSHQSTGTPILFWRDEIGISRNDTFACLVGDGVSSSRVEGADGAANSTSRWYHVACTYTGGSASGLRLYINGVEDPNGPANTSGEPVLLSNSSSVTIGAASSGSTALNGLMDDVRIYNRVLSDAEVAALARGDLPVSQASGSTLTLTSALDVDGDLTLSSMELDNDAANDYTITVAGSWVNNGGKFTNDGGTVTFDGTSGTHNVQAGNQDFYNLIFSGNGGAWTLDQSVMISNDLDVATGATLDTGAYDIILTNDLDIDGNLDLSTGYHSVSGSVDLTNGTITRDASTLVLNPATAGETLTAAAETLNNVTLSTTDGLVGWWKLDEPSADAGSCAGGEDFCDSSDNGYHATSGGASGSNTSGPAPAGDRAPVLFSNPRAFDFDGTDDRVTLPAGVPALTDFTFAMWVYLDSISSNAAIWHKGTSPENRFLLRATSEYFYINGNGTQSITTASNIGSWVHVLIARRGGTAYYYRNGVNEGSWSAGTDPIQFASSTLSASSAGAYSMNGRMDDVRLYSRALTASEITALYRGHPLSATGAVTLQDALTVDGDLVLGDGTFDVNDQTFTLNGSATIADAIFKTGTGAIAFGNAAGDAVTMTGGELQIESDGEDVTVNAGTWSNTGGTMTFLDDGAQTFLNNTTVQPFYNLTINDGDGTYTTTTNLDVNGAFTLTDGTVDLDTNDNNINVAGDFTLSAGTYTMGSGTLTLDGDLTFTDSIGTNMGVVAIGTSPDTTDLATDMICASLTVNSGDILNTNGYDIDCSGAITIIGALNATDDGEGDGTLITLGTNWSNSGTFTYADSTVDFDDDSQNNTIAGDTTFNNLTISTATAKSVTFTAGDTQTVAGTMTLTGAASNTLTLQSSSGGTVWNLDPTGTRTVDQLSVTDSYNPGSTIDVRALTVANGGNNTGWLFSDPGTITWTGEGANNNWSNGDNWFGGSAPSSVQVAFFDETSVKNCSIDAAIDIDGIDIGSGYDGTISQGTSAVTVGSSGWVQADGTFTGGSARIDVNGDVTLSGGTLTTTSGLMTISGSFTKSGGTFDDNSGTVMLDGTGAETLTSDSASFNNLTINDGLVGYWKLDETAGGGCSGGADACDTSGYGHHGAWTGDAAASATVPTVQFFNAGSVTFDGTGDYVDVGDIAVEAVDLSIFAWIRADVIAGDQRAIVAKWASATDRSFILRLETDGSVEFWTGASGAKRTAASTVSTGSWYNIAVIYDDSADDADIYVNGILVANSQRDDALSDIVDDAGVVRIGMQAGGSTDPFDGYIDDVRIYHRALSAAEIAALGRGDLPGVAASGSSVTLEDTLDINGDLTINAGDLNNKAAEDNTITIAGSWINNGGKFTNDGGTVTFDGTSGTHYIQSGHEDFYDVNVSGSADGWLLTADLIISNDLDVASGATLDTNAYDLVITNDMDIDGNLDLASGYQSVQGSIDFTNGTITEGTSTLVLNPSTAGETLTAAAETLNHLTVSSTDGLVAWYKMDEGADNTCSGGQDVCDSSGNAVHGTFGGGDGDEWSTDLAPVFMANSYAVRLDGSDDYISLGGSSHHSPGTDDYTVSAWVKYTAVPSFSDSLVYDLDNATADSYGISTSTLNRATCSYKDGATTVNVSSATDYLVNKVGRWTHYVCMRKGTSVHFYGNGGLIGSNSSTSLIDVDTDGGHAAVIGAYVTTGSTSTPGIIDDVRFYRRALTSSEIVALYRGHPMTASGGTITLQDALDIDGDMILGDGTFDANGQDIAVAGDWTNSAATFTSGAGTVTFDGGSTQSVNAGGTGAGTDDTGADFNNFTVSGSTLQLSGTEVEVDGTLTIDATKTLDLNGYDIDLNGTLVNNGTVQLQGSEDFGVGTLDTDSGLFQYVGTSSVTIPSTLMSYYGLEFDESGTSDPTYTLPDVNVTVYGDLTITDGTLAADDDKLLNIKGSFTNSGTFTHSLGTVMFSGTGAETLTSGGTSFNNLIINDGLVGYWELDESAFNSCPGGEDSCDSSGYGNHATEVSAPTITSTSAPLLFENPNALTFDGSADYVTAVDTGVYDFSSPTAQFTLGLWVNPVSIATRDIYVAKYWSDSTKEWFFAQNNNGTSAGKIILVTYEVAGDAGNFTGLRFETSSAVLTAGSWQHIAAVVDIGSDNVDLYVNGAEVASAAVTGHTAITDISNSSGQLTIGASINNGVVGGPADAVIDDVRIYNRALSASEIALLAAGTHPAAGASGSSLTLEDALDINGDLVINAGDLNNKAAEDNAITLAGSWINNGGGFTNDGGIVTFNGTSGTHEIQAGREGFYDVNVSGNGGTWNLAQAVIIRNDLTVSSGATLDTNAYDLVVENDMDIDGNLDLASGYHSVQGSVDFTNGTVTEDASTVILNPATAGETLTLAAETLTNVVLSSTDGLVGWWQMDETALNACNGGADDFCDSSANANHGDESGGVSISTSVAPVNFANARSLSFDGSDDYVNLGDIDAVEGIDALTVCSWARFDSLTPGVAGNGIVSKGGGNAASDHWLLARAGGSTDVYFGVYISSVLTASPTYTEDTHWRHYCGRYDGAGVTLFVDGSQNGGVTAASGNIDAGATTVKLGAYQQGDDYMDGLIDDVRIYNRALTAPEIAALYRGHPLSATGTITLQDTLDVDGDMVLADGTFVAGANTLTVSGDWTNSAAAFTYGTSTVDFDDDSGNNAISGDTTFYNLTISTAAAKTVTFESGSTTSIADNGTLTLSGASGQLLTLGPGTAATDWLIDVSATGTTIDADYLSVTYSDASGGQTIVAQSSVDGAPGSTNTNWFFPETYTWTGASDAITWEDAGNWDQSSYPSTVDAQVIINATAHNITTAGALTVGELEVTSGFSGSITLGGTLTTSTAAGWDGSVTLNGGTVTTGGSVDINGAFTLNGGTLDLDTNDNDMNVSGHFTLTSGTFTKGAGTLTLDGDLAFTDSIGTDIGIVEIGTSPDTTDLVTDMTCTTLTINLGDILNTNGYDIDCSGDITVTGTLDATDDAAGDRSYIYTGGSWTVSGTFTADDSTVIFDGTGAETLTSGGASFNNVLINDGLVGYWKFDEMAFNTCVGGEDACDSSGYGYHATEVGTTTISASIPTVHFYNSRSFEFDGSSAYLDTNAAVFDPTDEKLTFAAWMNTDSIAVNQKILGKRDTDNNDGYHFEFEGATANDPISFGIYGALDVDSTATGIVAGTWYHVGVTYDKTDVRFYLNGILLSSSGVTSDIGDASEEDLYIGAYSSDGTATDRFDGKLDDVRIYNRVLSAAEMAALARGDLPGTAASGSSVTLADALDINGDLTINSGDLSNSAANDYAITVAGSWMNNGGKFTQDGGTVTFDGMAGASYIQAGNEDFNILQLNGTGGTWSLLQDVIIADDLDVDAGTLDTNGYDLVIADDMDIDADLDLASGYHSVGGVVDFTNGTITGGTSTLVLNPSTAGETLTASAETLTNLALTSTDGLVAWWKFDETALNGCSGGEDACDSSGIGNHATEGGTVAVSVFPAPVNFGNLGAFSFDGTDDYLTYPGTELALPGDYSISFWVLTKATNGYTIIRNSSSVSNTVALSKYEIRIDGDSIDFITGDGTTADTDIFAVTNPIHRWANFTCVQSGATKACYKNGSLVGSSANDVDNSATVGTRFIGTNRNSAGNRFLNGLLDDLRIYNRALTSHEIAALAGGHPLSNTGTVTLQDALDVDGDMHLGDGAFVANGQVITIAGDWINSAATFTSGANTVTFDGGSTQSINAGGTGIGNDDGGADFNNLTISGSTLQLTGTEVEVDGTLIIDVTKTLDLNGYDLDLNGTLANAGTVLLEGGESVAIATADTDSGLFKFDGTTSVTIPSLTEYHHLEFDESGTSDPTYTLPDAAVTVYGDFTITDGTVAADDDKLLNLKGSFTNSDTFTHNSGNAMLSGTGADTLTSNGDAFYNLTLNDGLVGYWKMDETAADSCAGGVNDACDSSGYGYDGTWQGDASDTSTVPTLHFNNPRSVTFDGTGDYVDISGAANFDSTIGTWTLWVKTTQATDQYYGIMGRSDTDSCPGIMITQEQTTGNILVQIKSASLCGNPLNLNSTSAINDGNWHALALTFNGDGTSALYIDGVSHDSGVAPAGWAFSTSYPVRLGRLSDSFWKDFTGQLDDVRIYNRILSSSEIAHLANGLHPVTAASGSSVTLADALDVDGDLMINSGDLNNSAANDYAITVAGSWWNNGGKFTNDGGTVTFDGNSGATNYLQAGGEDFYTVHLNGAADSWLLTADLIISNDLDSDAGTLDTNGYDLVITNDMDIDGNLDLASGYHSVMGSVDFTNGTITPDTSTLIVNPSTAGETLAAAAETLNTFTLTSTDGLVGWWKLDETVPNACAGGVNDACDSSANGHDGAYSGSPAASTDLAPLNFSNARSLEFDGADHIGFTNVNLDGQNEMTIALWIKPDLTTVAVHGLVHEWSSSSGGPILFINGTDDIYWQVDSSGAPNGGRLIAANVLTADVWQHVAATFAEQGATDRFVIYHNGAEANADSLGSTNTAHVTTFKIGHSDGVTNRYHGLMDDVRVYNRALTAPEVAALYRGHPLSATGTITLQGALDIDGDMVLGDGTFVAGSNTITVAGDWTNGAATFTAGTGTVDFDDDTQDNTIRGSTSFYNVVISTGTAKTVWLESGKTQTILASGSLTLTGTSGQVLTLAPLTAATDWLLTDNGASQSVSYVTVTYSDASGGNEILTSNTTDGAPGSTNTNWCFTACLGDGTSMITGMTF